MTDEMMRVTEQVAEQLSDEAKEIILRHCSEDMIVNELKRRLEEVRKLWDK